MVVIIGLDTSFALDAVVTIGGTGEVDLGGVVVVGGAGFTEVDVEGPGEDDFIIVGVVVVGGAGFTIAGAGLDLFAVTEGGIGGLPTGLTGVGLGVF